MGDEKNPNDFAPKRGDGKKPPRVFAFVKPDLETHVDDRELKNDTVGAIVCRCDTVCTCNTVSTGKAKCRCDTVSRCTCESVVACSCDTVRVCSCDAVRKAPAPAPTPVPPPPASCSCDSHSAGGGGSRVCRCVPVRAH